MSTSDLASAIEQSHAALGAILTVATGGGSDGSERLFEFDIEHVLLSTYKKGGEPDNWPPRYEKWHAHRPQGESAGR